MTPIFNHCWISGSSQTTTLPPFSLVATTPPNVGTAGHVNNTSVTNAVTMTMVRHLVHTRTHSTYVIRVVTKVTSHIVMYMMRFIPMDV